MVDRSFPKTLLAGMGGRVVLMSPMVVRVHYFSMTGQKKKKKRPSPQFGIRKSWNLSQSLGLGKVGI